MGYGQGDYGAGPYGVEVTPGDYGSGAYGRGPYGRTPVTEPSPVPVGGVVRFEPVRPKPRRLFHDHATGEIRVAGYASEHHQEFVADHAEELLLLLA